MVLSLDKIKEMSKDYVVVPPIWGLIKKAQVGIVFGVSKSGKTILIETLVYNILTGSKEFLGKKINEHSMKVTYISLEEEIIERYKNKIEIQLAVFSKQKQKQIKKNLRFSSNDFPIPINLKRKKHKEQLEDDIATAKDGILIFDSLNMVINEKENQEGANYIMTFFVKMADKYNCAIILIHHTNKHDSNKILDINVMAGSAAFTRQAHYIIGLNKLANGVCYYKEMMARRGTHSTKVHEYSVSEDHLFIGIKDTEEADILFKNKDGRSNNKNAGKQKLLALIKEHTKEKGTTASTAFLKRKMLGTVSSKTTGTYLSELLEDGKIFHPHGKEGEWSYKKKKK